MNFDLIKGGAIIGLIMGFWTSIKDMLLKIISLFIQKVELNTVEANDTLVSFLVENYELLNLYDKSYGAINENLRNGRFGQIFFEKYGVNSLIFKTKKRYLKFFRLYFLYIPQKNNEKKGNETGAAGTTDEAKVHGQIFCLRGSLDIDKIIMNANNRQNSLTWQIDESDKKQTRFDIFYLPSKKNDHHAFFSKTNTGFPWHMQKRHRLLGFTSSEIGRPYSSKGHALANLFFEKKIKDLIDLVRLWKKSEQWYKEKGIPWKRGWLLYGMPGTGKTALARAFAEDLNMPIYVYSLAQMANADLMTAWKNMQLNVPCIALIEDIDNVFHGRKNIVNRSMLLSNLALHDKDSDDPDGMMPGMLTFDCLLNCIDGVDKSEGVFTIITTNDVTKIDSAIGKPIVNSDGTFDFISSRPGRIDMAIQLGYMDKKSKLEMVSKIFNDSDASWEYLKEHIAKNLNETPAQFQEFCSQIALQNFWDKEKISGIQIPEKLNGKIVIAG